MNTNNYLPFDLETALKHPERVVTRDGRKVRQFTKFESNSEFTVIVVLDNEVQSFRVNGTYQFGNRESQNDLFLLPEVKECWVNVYEEKGKGFNIGDAYKSKQDAIDKIADTPEYTYIKTIRITNEPE